MTVRQVVSLPLLAVGQMSSGKIRVSLATKYLQNKRLAFPAGAAREKKKILPPI